MTSKSNTLLKTHVTSINCIGSTQMNNFPKECLVILPFEPEPISQWTIENDLKEFIACLLPYSEHFFVERQTEFQTIASEFYLKAYKSQPSESAKNQIELIPNFHEDASFGHVSKYIIAWFIIAQSLLEESTYFSITHILESYSELECSVLLASNLYYKQAMQVLRNFLENIILQLYFCDAPENYRKWKNNDYRTPPLRGKNGVLIELVRRGILSENLETIAADLYGKLNGSVHGIEDRLIHRGIFTGQYAGKIFKYDHFQEWCDYTAKCVDFAIQAQQIIIELWESKLPESGIRCSICHDINNFDLIESEDFPDHSTTTIKCRNCGDVSSYDKKWLENKGMS